jgi:hypothetical protein
MRMLNVMLAEGRPDEASTARRALIKEFFCQETGLSKKIPVTP